MDQAQEGDNIFDLTPPVKALRTDQSIGQTRLQKRLFDQTRHGVGTIHHRAVAWLELPGSHELCDRVYDEGGFCVIIRRFVEKDLLSLATLCEEFLTLAIQGAVDDAHRGVQDVLMRTIVLFEQNRLCIGEILLEALHVAPVCTTPCVYRLIGITDHKDILIKGSKLSDQRVLGEIGILEFIHQHMTEALGVFVAHGRIVFEQARGVHEQIVEIDGVAGDEPLLILHIYALHDLVAIRCRRILVGPDQLILGA